MITAQGKEWLLRAADFIEKNPERFDMNMWCGTSCCVAGTIMFLADKTLKEGSVRETVFPMLFGKDLPMYESDREGEWATTTPEELLYENLFVPPGVSLYAINEHRLRVPEILRWMVENEHYDWRSAARALHIERL